MIIVVSSPEDKLLIEPVLVDFFSHTIHTPQAEKEFMLHFRDPWELDDIKKYGNILFVSFGSKRESFKIVRIF